jgi:hypothetical protein
VTSAEDAARIRALLCGELVRDDRGRPRTVYLKLGSNEEKEARRALARMLRSSLPLDPGVRFVLGDLIDPDLTEVEQIIRFEHRRKGKPSNALAGKEIAESIWSQTRAGEKTETAVNRTMKQFGIGRSRTMDIWKYWQPILKRLKHPD